MESLTAKWDCLIKGGTVVLKDAVKKLDIGIRGGKIVDLHPELKGEAENIIDAKDCIIMPGMIDAHVHLNEPGLGDWEGFLTGSAALAAGGCTTFIDMPLNGVPPTVNETALRLKLEAAKGNSYVDYALWGGLVPGNIDHLQSLQNNGVVGFKAFMSSPGGIGEDAFQEVDDQTLFEGMKRIAEMDAVLALHAEDEQIVSEKAAFKRRSGAVSPQDYTESRPIEAELRAVEKALDFAARTHCPLHFVHISSPQAVEVINQAKEQQMNVSLETCPHYLVLTSADLENLGAVAKCAPPLRSHVEQSGLWDALLSGSIDMIASDHSPCPSSMKLESDDTFAAWGGISGAQHTFELMFDEAYKNRSIELPILSRLLSYEPARRFGLAHRKGEIAIGKDADVIVVEPDYVRSIEQAELKYRHRHSPYIGRQLTNRICKTLCRGEVVYDCKNGTAHLGHGMWIQAQHQA